MQLPILNIIYFYAWKGLVVTGLVTRTLLPCASGGNQSWGTECCTHLESYVPQHSHHSLHPNIELYRAKRLWQGLVNFVPAIAYHVCLSLPAAFTQPGQSLLAELCTLHFSQICHYHNSSLWCLVGREVMADPTAAADAEHAAAAPAAFLLAVVHYWFESEEEESSLASHKPQNPTVSDETKLVYNIIIARLRQVTAT